MGSKLIDLLQSTTLESIINHKDTHLISLDGETPLREALQVLAISKILSIPVWDKVDGSWLGFIDCCDIVTLAIESLLKGKEIKPDEWSHFSKDFRNLISYDVSFSTVPIKKVLNASKRDKFVPVYPFGTVYQLVEDVFFKGIHRVPVFDDISSEKILQIVSQSDVMYFLATHVDFLEDIGQLTVKELNLGTRGAIVSPTSMPAVHAFYLMDKHKVSAVAIVNPSNGVLLANLSVTDIRGISESKFHLLLEPVHQFFLAAKGTIIPPVTCSLNTDFATVIRKIVYFRIHRLWITDFEGKPIGVISLTDVMKTMINFQDEEEKKSVGHEKKQENLETSPKI